MNKPFVFAALLSVSAALAAPGALAAGDASAGKSKASTCAGCHGADGNSANPIWPKLAGQHAGYTVKQLQDFKSGARENATMKPMATALSEQDMQDLAAYYTAQQIQYGEADPALVDQGEKLYRGGNKASGVSACMACHGPAGKGNPAANFPALAGQHAEYTAIQLKAFRSGARANDYGGMMRNIASRMTDAEIEAVASYIQGLR